MSIVCENKIKVFKMDESHLEFCFDIEKNSSELPLLDSIQFRGREEKHDGLFKELFSDARNCY